MWSRMTVKACSRGISVNMLYESIVKRGSLMVVPSGLADSLKLPGILGIARTAGMTENEAAGAGEEEGK